MSTFQSRVSEVTIEMDGLHVTTVSALEPSDHVEHDEARVGDFHMSKFTLDEWDQLSALIRDAIEQVTK
jgi:hypothetical protein